MSLQHKLILTCDPILETECVGGPYVEGCGAVVRFSGVVRPSENSAEIQGLEYEAFDAMVRHQFGLLFSSMGEKFPSVKSVKVIHRLGYVPAGEASLWVEVSAPHRAEAFTAMEQLIDRMKEVVPIWKRVR